MVVKLALDPIQCSQLVSNHVDLSISRVSRDTRQLSLTSGLPHFRNISETYDGIGDFGFQMPHGSLAPLACCELPPVFS